MSLNGSSANDVVIGGTYGLFKVDLLKPSTLQTIPGQRGLSFIRTHSKLLILGKNNGSFELYDTTSAQSVRTFHSHTGFLLDMDVQGNYVATCGYSLRPKRFHSGPNDFLVDLLVNIYDLRMMRSLPPIPFPAGASFIRFHPKLPNIMIIASTTGQIQLVDIYDQLNVFMYQADLTGGNTLSSTTAPTSSFLANLDISENGEFMCFSDGFLNLHLWSFNNAANKNFLNFPSPLEQPDVPSQQHAPVAVDEQAPLSSVGMPYYKEFLLSNYATDLVFDKELLKLPVEVDPALLELDAGLRAMNRPRFMPYDRAKYGPRNLYRPYEPLKETKNGASTTGKNTKPHLLRKFISERNISTNSLSKTVSNGSTDLADLPNHSSNDNNDAYNDSDNASTNNSNDDIFQYKVYESYKPNKVPNCYTKLQIQYSKFGVADFDFDYYNKSTLRLSGLENHLDNSYINALLQVYRYSPAFYNSVVRSIMPEWLPNDEQLLLEGKNPQGTSILNELGYLFDMMYKANGKNVKIANFSEVLNQNSAARQQGLVNVDEGRTLSAPDLQKLIIGFNKFLVETVNSDRAHQTGNSDFSNLTNVRYEIEIRSNGCDFHDVQYGNQLTLDLLTPPPNVLNMSKINLLVKPGQSAAMPRKSHTVLTYLEYSLNQVKVLPCQNHVSSPYHQPPPHQLEFKQTVVQLPPLLVLNLNFSSQEFQLVKGFKSWLVPEFYATKSLNRVNFRLVVADGPSAKYELLGFVCEISHGPDHVHGQHNVVLYVKVGEQWHLFNDFLVMPLPQEEVFNLQYQWKRPLALFYSNVDSVHNQGFRYWTQEAFSRAEGLNKTVLYRDHFACGVREGYRKEYELLMELEAPGPGTLVAIDAEFVTLQPEELEISYDGSKNTVKPKKLSLARISVIRGDNGPKQGVPFIDDYILHTVEIHDYLTSFSGIEPGDLDPHRSTKNLVTLQTAYRRLWLLLNMGCVFVGHGLINDFRTINLQVPAAQIRDTIDFFFLPEYRRRLSLKFLAYVLLKENVQTGNHDLIEDAYTALLLYKKYIELTAVGDFEATLHRIYMEGQQLRFRVPE